ncbi:lytic murein transglycosylase [Vibrio sp.]|nr:lytic murein transglycosylase [Vibrio sp.]
MKKIMSVGLGVLLSFSSYANQVSFEDYVNSLKTEAKAKGISEKTIQDAFAKVEYKPRAIVADKNQPEKRLTLDEYIPRAVPDWKVEQAKKLYREHEAELNRIGEQYGVSPRYIVALWGVESNFGKYTGGYQVINALSTLAYDGRREVFFRDQTMAALKIIDEGHISAQDMKGSWAGAMGQCQFMPTSFLSFAADGNGDGKKDIWKTPADVFASTANYLSQSGWDKHHIWGRQVKVPQGFDMSQQGREKGKGKMLSEWAKLGVMKYNGQPLPTPTDDVEAWLIAPDDENGRVYLVYNNYNVLMKWNRSYYFALAVTHLADRIIL